MHHLVEEYMEKVRTCLDLFQECLVVLFEDSASEAAKASVQNVDDAESQADELRDKIEFKLYRKALMPESRGDILGLIESIDRIPNWAEEIVYNIHLQRIQFPAALIEKFRHLARMNVECFFLLNKAVEALFTDIDAVFELTKAVDRQETEIDALEHELIRDIFNSEESELCQMKLHRVVRDLCDISDKTENAGDRLTIIAIKKMI